ncbi:MAG: diacylglycerol kinase [Deltaproteobacteria bacterium]|nr:diacylglycerol kinase [Deltaproteobacteria bacterium]MCZ6624988.1 diacylglycerol kinase [Deltaproteobacteria bacterium]
MAESLQRLVKATRYSLKGLQAAFRREQAFRQEVLVLVFVIPAGLWLGKNGVERVLLIGSWLLVMVVELINSAIEAVVDRVGLERNELAGRAKDLGSAAVFCAIVLAIALWVVVLVAS